MPTGTKGGYDKARETYARENGGGNGNFFGGVGDSIDKGIGSIGNAIGNFFSGSGGGGGDTGRPPKRPDYGVVGSGKDAVYVNTKTGEKTPMPGYTSYSWKGLTSNDPGNVIRNQMAAQRYAAMPQRESSNQGPRAVGPGGLGGRGIASLVNPTPPPVTPPVATPSLPVLAPTAGYPGAAPSNVGNPLDVAMGASPMGYGSAFAGLSQPAQSPFGGMSLMDIFAMYPELQYI